MVWDNFESVLPQFNDGAADHGSPYTDDEPPPTGRSLPRPDQRPGQRLPLGHVPPRRDRPSRRHEVRAARPCAGRQPVAAAPHPRARQHQAQRSPLSREKLDPLLHDLADHPLSLELVGPHLRSLTPEEIRADFGNLVATMQQDSDQARNTSLLASLEFSRRHLSADARAALPWLGLFHGGVFEQILLDVSQIAPAAWEAIRTELQGIASAQYGKDIQIGTVPSFVLHPAAALFPQIRRSGISPRRGSRFLGVYLAVMHMLENSTECLSTVPLP